MLDSLLKLAMPGKERNKQILILTSFNIWKTKCAFKNAYEYKQIDRLLGGEQAASQPARQTERQTDENLPQDSGTLLQLTLSEKKQVYFRTNMLRTLDALHLFPCFSRDASRDVSLLSYTHAVSFGLKPAKLPFLYIWILAAR